MRVNFSNISLKTFKGRREDRNTIKQLKQNNDYSLTENNQININKAITNLSNEPGEKNIEFLLDVAKDLKYGTNIDLDGKKSKNEWKEKLHNAANKSLLISDPITSTKLAQKVSETFETDVQLSDDEQNILSLRESILSRLDKKQLDNETNPNIKRVNENLDYFIISSETPIKQKKYVLERLDYMLSPDYKINKQLENKKTRVFAEIINDLVIDTPLSKVPNTKAINQKHHGMCAAISIVRKLMSYEDKPNFVDSILSELDDTDKLMVYDKNRLGENVKIPVQKASVDFADAEKKGYRIIDAAATEWMNVGQMYCANNKPILRYIPFDAEHFGVNDDSTYLNLIPDENLKNKHLYYQSLIKSNDVISAARKSKLEKKYNSEQNRISYADDMAYLQDLNSSMSKQIHNVIPSLNKHEVHNVVNNLIKLRVPTSSKIDSLPEKDKKYYFIPNEENSIKEAKISSYIISKYDGKVDYNSLKDNVKNIRELIEENSCIQNKLMSNTSLSGKVSSARKLYEAAAAYRNSTITALNDDSYEADYMIKLGIPDTETLLSDNISKVIKHIDKTSDKEYINHFSNVFNIEPNKDAVVKKLISVKTSLDETLTNGLNELYKSLGIGSKNEIVLKNVQLIKQAIEDGDKDELHTSSVALGLKNDDKIKVLKQYNQFEQTLINGATNDEFIEIFNKLGCKSQLKAFADVYSSVYVAIQNGNDENYKPFVAEFNKANGLDEDAAADKSILMLAYIGKYFNKISDDVSKIRSAMKITDSQGNILNSAYSDDVIIEKLEKNGEIVSEKDLRPFQKRFNAIDKLRSQDEFSSRQGKISDTSLYKFTAQEKQTLKNIDKSLNKMYSNVNKELASVLSEIRKPLEEHVRRSGVDRGIYWVSADGSSGLFNEQEVKILQQITGKKYHISENVEDTVSDIKNGTHSGISGTSVFHDRHGGHAQYIVEISKAGNSPKEVLYHDNSWGASELENTWKDSNGLTRTDYSDCRGGELGYITNEHYRNGNYVENLMYKPGHISVLPPDNKELKKLSSKYDEYDFPIMHDAIVPGADDKAHELAAGIKDTLFIPISLYIDDLKKSVSNMSKKEVQAAIERNKTAGRKFHKDFDIIEKRVKNSTFNNGINNQAEYDALDSKDIIKINFEKVALTRSYSDGIEWKKLAKVNDANDLQEFIIQRDNKAKENFDYSFAKDDKILLGYVYNKKANKTLDILNDAFKKYNINITEADKIKIIKNTAVYSNNEKSKFDGSLKNTIDFTTNKLLKQFDEIIPDSENARLAKADIKNNLTKTLSKELYFNIDDLNTPNDNMKGIYKFIDRKFNPQTDEELVEIYKNIQDMTNDEYAVLTSDVTKEELGIKNYTGYEMLKRFKGADNNVETSLKNVMFQRELLNDIKLSNTKPSYKYFKLNKTLQGTIYKGNRTFDDLYREFYFSLQSLEYKKSFNKYKDKNYREYKAMPSYPYIDLIDPKEYDKKIDIIDSTVNDIILCVRSNKSTLRTYELFDTLSKSINSLSDESKLSKKQYKSINNMAGEMFSILYNDESLPKTLNSIDKILSLNPSSKGFEFKEAFAEMNEEFSAIKQINTVDTIKNNNAEYIKSLKDMFNVLLINTVPEKHHNVLKEDINNWINEELKPTDDEKISLKINVLSKRIDDLSLNKKTFKTTKNAYLKGLSADLLNLKVTKIASNLCTVANNDTFEALNYDKNILTSSLNNEKACDDFNKFIANLIYTDKTIDDKTINNIINKFIKKHSDNDSQLINSDIIKDLSINICQLKENNKLLKIYQKNINEQIETINNYSDKFIKGNIIENYSPAIKSKVDDLINLSVNVKPTNYNEKKSREAHDKFIVDYKKYHYLNSPIDLFDNYLLLNAKDTFNEPLSDEQSQEIDSKESMLLSALSVASLVEIQELLMNAVETGSPASIVNEFDKYNVDTTNDLPVSMNDDSTIDYMVKSLIIGNNYDTAKMFVDKLGLAKRFIQYQNNNFDIEGAKKLVKKMSNIYGTTSAQQNIVYEETNIFNDKSFDTDDNYIEKIDQVKQIIINRTKRMSRKRVINDYLKALDEAKKIIEANPAISRSTILAQMIANVAEAALVNANADIDNLNEDISSLDIINEFINKLDIPEYSDAYDELKKYNKTYNEYRDYANSILLKLTNN